MSYASTILATSGLVGYWRKNTSSPGTDLMGGRDVTYTGPPINVTGLLTGDADEAIEYNQGTGTGSGTQHGTVTDAVALRPAAFSIECWIRKTTAQAGATGLIFKSTDDSWGNGWGIYLENVASVTHVRFFASSFGVFVDTTIVNSTTYHVVGTFSAGTATLYVNGVSVGTPLTSLTHTASTGSLYMGSAVTTAGASFYYSGVQMDEVAFYNRALTSTEVSDHWTAGSTFSATNTPSFQAIPFMR